MAQRADRSAASDVIGLVPAAGQATRLGPLPCSKEILPVGFAIGEAGTPRPRAACEPLLTSFRTAGIRRAFVLLRNGKWDIPAYLGSGEAFGLDLAYLALAPTPSVPATLDRAYPFVRQAVIALGFPDIFFTPHDAYAHLLTHLQASTADVVLGLFPSTQSWKTDMVALDEQGTVRQIVIKQPDRGLRFTWSIAVWRPAFSTYLHDHLATAGAPAGERYVGDVIQSAIDDGLRVEAVTFADGSFLDVGTPDDLHSATAQASRPSGT